MLPKVWVSVNSIYRYAQRYEATGDVRTFVKKNGPVREYTVQAWRTITSRFGVSKTWNLSLRTSARTVQQDIALGRCIDYSIMLNLTPSRNNLPAKWLNILLCNVLSSSGLKFGLRLPCLTHQWLYGLMKQAVNYIMPSESMIRGLPLALYPAYLPIFQCCTQKNGGKLITWMTYWGPGKLIKNRCHGRCLHPSCRLFGCEHSEC